GDLMASQESAGEQIPAAAENGGMRATPGKSFAVPRWANDAGRWSWITLGLVILLIAFLALLAATRVLVVSALFAVLLGGTFLPVVDALHKRHFPRWLAALLVVVLLIALAVGIALVIIYGVVNQAPEMQQRLDEAQAELQKALNTTSVPQSTLDSAKAGLQELYKSAASGVAGALSSAISNVGTLLFGIFISLNILMWVLIQGRKMGAWASHHMGSVPPPVGYAILANSARFLRGYIWGSTLTGLFNGGVMAVGALVIGVPMAATIGIVGWFTNYIPFFGAIVSGAFAVLIALAAGGPAMAIPMLIIVIISNGYLQTLISQFALGATLKLHPLVVLFATTAGSLLFGAIGGVFAAPFLKIGLDAVARLRAAGVFSDEAATPSIDPSQEQPR
ncbi:MAG TPA: AI-2E family transporter, partial [Rhodospirillales bacterium]|nr:AI-2E family transporter [Rhodospirillales bacterium]